ncbi:MAG: PqqD family protein [Armatimonadota bacterium]
MRRPGTLNRILEKLRLKKRTPFVTPEQARKAVPVRHPMIKWEVQEDGTVTITIPRRNDLKVRLLSILFPMPEQRTVALDEVGSEVWHMCDGTHTVGEMVTRFAKKYKLNRREAEVSLKEFLNTLVKRHYVGLQLEKAPIQEPSAAPDTSCATSTSKARHRRRRRRRKRPTRSVS